MNFYMTLFGNSKVVEIKRYKENEAGPEGSVMHATFTLNGQQFMCIDSPSSHGFAFTPSMSLYVHCESEAEIEKLCEQLSEDGGVFMPMAAYPFSKKYCWVSDKYGVSWQLDYNH